MTSEGNLAGSGRDAETILNQLADAMRETPGENTVRHSDTVRERRVLLRCLLTQVGPCPDP
jgi:hypothetical protein